MKNPEDPTGPFPLVNTDPPLTGPAPGSFGAIKIGPLPPDFQWQQGPLNPGLMPIYPVLPIWPPESVRAVGEMGRRISELEASLSAVQASANEYVKRLRWLGSEPDVKRQKVVLVDMDGILADLLTPWLAYLEGAHGIKSTHSDITEWSVHKCEPFRGLTPKQVYGCLQLPLMFRNAPPIAGALEELQSLHDDGFKVVIASSPSGPLSAAEKLEWLAEHAPWLPREQVFLGNMKTLLRGDFLIDDHPDTLLDWQAEWPYGKAIGIEYQYNRHVGDRVFLAPDYQNTAAAWKAIGQKIRKSV